MRPFQLALAMIALGVVSAHAEDTWIYAVQLSATVQKSPPQIRLGWPADKYGANSYTVYRKAKTDPSWGTGAPLSGSATNYTDTNVVVGATYEYRVVKAATLGYTGYGYVFAGIEAPLTEDRGKLLLVVATNCTATLSSELARLQSDLAGDGWTVLRRDVSSNQTPASVKSIITQAYYIDPTNTRAVFLFGHVPILQSGNLNYDGHLARPMPADAYYGDMDGDWSGSPDFLPSDVELMVGRVDMFNLPGVGAAIPWPNETELLRNYLNKDHNWRHKLIAVPRRALMGDRRGGEEGQATAASGYRNFEPLVGPGNTTLADVEDNSLVSDRWTSKLAANRYLWAYGCGGGMPSGISHLGTHGQYHEAWSIDIVGQDSQAVFVMLFGSWFGNWDGTDNFMRAFLATPTMGLACCMAGRPHWFVHHMGLGETLGYGARLSMNNSTLYQNDVNQLTRAIYIALMGDPTLRLDPVAPVPAVNVATGNGNVMLTWTASPDSVAGYHVYRSASAAGPFTRRTSVLTTNLFFTDTSVPPGAWTYQVRAIKLQSTPSGSYFNSSQGIFTNVVVPSAIQLTATRIVNGVVLAWNSDSGFVYHVETKPSLTAGAWSNASGSILATSPQTSWTNLNPGPQRFYRVSRP